MMRNIEKLSLKEVLVAAGFSLRLVTDTYFGIPSPRRIGRGRSPELVQGFCCFPLSKPGTPETFVLNKLRAPESLSVVFKRTLNGVAVCIASGSYGKTIQIAKIL
jgi:hypothetical protein